MFVERLVGKKIILANFKDSEFVKYNGNAFREVLLGQFHTKMGCEREIKFGKKHPLFKIIFY